MKHGQLDPLRPLRDAIPIGEQAAVARARGAQICREVAAAIGKVPAVRRAARRRHAAASASAIVLVGLCASHPWARGRPSPVVSMAAATFAPATRS